MKLDNGHILDLRKIYIDIYIGQIIFGLVGAILVMVGIKLPLTTPNYHYYDINMYISGGVFLGIGLIYMLVGMVVLGVIMLHENGKNNWKMITGLFINSFAIGEVYKL